MIILIVVAEKLNIFIRMFWRKLLPISKRMMSTIAAKNQIEKVVQSQLEKVSAENSHKLWGVAQEILRLQRDATDIIDLTREAEKDKELKAIAEKDLAVLTEQIGDLRKTFLYELVDSYRVDPIYQKCQEVLLEVLPGVGGQEAMLFSKELLNAYTSYAEYRNWDFKIVNYDVNEMGGLRHGSILITSSEAYKNLSLESGVHRVQRVPKTEKAGRIHTSTSTVSLLPTIDDLDIKLDEKDLRIETKKASGAGGQHVNTTESAVRITHIPTGITVDCQTERSQIRNRAAGLKLLMNKVYKLEYEKSLKLSKDLKKMQIGFGERSDKIRTYNYPQDRVTDHRYGFTVHNVQELLQGRDLYDNFLAEIKTREVDRVLNLL